MTAAKKTEPRALAHCVYYTDPDDGKLTVYQAGDVPAPAHAARIGDHAFTPAEEWSPAAADLAAALRGGAVASAPELKPTPAASPDGGR